MIDLIKHTLNNKPMDKFAALSEPNRRRIVEMIAASGSLAAKDISDQFSISPPAVSQHLKVLREAGLLNMEKRAQQRIYTVNPEGLDDMWEWMNHMRQFWNTRLDRLDALLKSEQSKPKGDPT